MKTKRLLFSLAAATVAFGAVGCGASNTAATPAPTTPVSTPLLINVATPEIKPWKAGNGKAGPKMKAAAQQEQEQEQAQEPEQS